MLDDVVTSYLDYLLTLPEHRDRFAQRLEDDAPGARAEGAMFAFLRAEGCEPMLSEDTGTGADFCCLRPERFVVEVTSLEDATLANRAGIQQDVPANGEGGALDMEEVLNLIRTTVSGKAAQLADYPVPRVLAIRSQHWGTSMFFGPGGAEEIMYGGSNIAIPFANEGAAGPAQIMNATRPTYFPDRMNVSAWLSPAASSTHTSPAWRGGRSSTPTSMTSGPPARNARATGAESPRLVMAAGVSTASLCAHGCLASGPSLLRNGARQRF